MAKGDEVAVIVFVPEGEREPIAEVFASEVDAQKRLRELHEKKNFAHLYPGPLTVRVK